MSTNLHEQDFYGWTQQQAHLLRSGRLSELDVEHLVEEIESMGASEQNQLQNRLRILLAHLLKWQFQPAHRGRSWLATIEEQRLSLRDLLDENPSLKPHVDERIRKAYPLAVLLAVKETDLDKSSFPLECPYGREQIFDFEYLPG
jgi:hypothetical protein